MSDDNESFIRNEDGELIAVRATSEHNGGTRVVTQRAFVSVFGGVHRTDILDDRDVYSDGSEYAHNGRRLK